MYPPIPQVPPIIRPLVASIIDSIFDSIHTLVTLGSEKRREEKRKLGSRILANGN